MLGLRDYKQFFRDREGMSVKNKLIDIGWEFRYAWQRVYRGYDNTEIFELNNKFIERYQVILRHLRRIHHGYPTNMTSKEWERILRKMATQLEAMDEDSYSSENYEEINKCMNFAKDNFFKLFEEHFWSL